jgi:hypothetical protein
MAGPPPLRQTIFQAECLSSGVLHDPHTLVGEGTEAAPAIGDDVESDGQFGQSSFQLIEGDRKGARNVTGDELAARSDIDQHDVAAF